MILEICEHGSLLKRDHDLFIVKNRDEKAEIPAEKVDAVIVTANALISTAAVKLCQEKEIQLVVAQWSGRPIGRFWASTPGKATQIRRWQYLNQDTKDAYDLSRQLLLEKLREQKRMLARLKNNRPAATPELETGLSVIEDMIKRTLRAPFTPRFKQDFLGLEGQAAAAYFPALSSVLAKKYRFTERSRNPARDPFNAALNYAYGIGYGAAEKTAILSGLDPNAGFYHADAYGKATLTFDLIEIIRPKLDWTVTSLFTKKKVRKSWFTEQEAPPGVFLSKDGRKGVLTAYVEKAQKDAEKRAWTFCRKIVKTATKTPADD